MLQFMRMYTLIQEFMGIYQKVWGGVGGGGTQPAELKTKDQSFMKMMSKTCCVLPLCTHRLFACFGCCWCSAVAQAEIPRYRARLTVCAVLKHSALTGSHLGHQTSCVTERFDPSCGQKALPVYGLPLSSFPEYLRQQWRCALVLCGSFPAITHISGKYTALDIDISYKHSAVFLTREPATSLQSLDFQISST